MQFLFKENKPWLVAYNELDSSDRPSAQRPNGQPLIFIPGDTVGDPITSEVINGAPVLAVALSMKILLSFPTSNTIHTAVVRRLLPTA